MFASINICIYIYLVRIAVRAMRRGIYTEGIATARKLSGENSHDRLLEKVRFEEEIDVVYFRGG